MVSSSLSSCYLRTASNSSLTARKLRASSALLALRQHLSEQLLGTQTQAYIHNVLLEICMCLCMITHSTSSHSASASNGSGMQSRVLRAFCSSRKKSRMGSKALRTSSIPSMMKPISGQPRAMSVTCLIASHPLPITPRPVIEMLYVSYWMVYIIFFHPYTYLSLCSNCWCEMMLCYSINPVITDHQY